MKILIWYWGRKGGGAKYSEEIARGFINLDKENTFLSFSKQSDIFDNVNKLTDKSFHINTYGSKIGFLLKSILLPVLIIRFIIFVKINKITHIYTTMPHIWTVLFIPFFKIVKILHIITIHDATPHPGDPVIWKLINKFLVNNAYRIVVLSNYVKKELIKYYRLESKSIIVSIHGLLSYSNLDYKEKVFNENSLRLVFFGRIEKYKGLEYLLKAQIELEKEYNDIYLEVYGSGNIDSYKKLIKNIKNIKLENRWLEDDEIYDIFSKPCINIATYIEASQSGTIPIALSSGIPTIATNIGALSEQVINNETGIVIESENISSNLVQVIEKLYHDKNILTNMSQNSIIFTQKYLDCNIICKNLKDKIINV